MSIELITDKTALHDLIDQNFLEYASYVIKERAIPALGDGLKPVQRRILHTLHEVDDGKFHKVANIVGHTMRYHPHGDASIEDALVHLAQKNYLIDQQGNFGNPVTGDPASAARYIECRLSPLAKETLFNPEITDFTPSYDGRNKEPIVLPAKIPILLMSGTEGIAVGLATKMLPHNFIELLQAEIAYLKHQPFELYPDFPTGGLIDISQYQRGMGKVMVRARIDIKDSKTLTIREIPFGTTTESLIASIEQSIHKGKLKISSINDYTTEQVEIELKLGHGVQADEVLPRLYLYSDCETTISLNPILINQAQPQEMDVHQILEHQAEALLNILTQELNVVLAKLQEKQHLLQLTHLFISQKMYQSLEEAEDLNQWQTLLLSQLQAMGPIFPRSVSPHDIDFLVNIPLKKISRFDVNSCLQEKADNQNKIDKINKDLQNIKLYAIGYLNKLIKKYETQYPRKTELGSFDKIDVKKVAVQDIKVYYDASTGFIGTGVKSNESLLCSSFDKLLLFFPNGSYKVQEIPEKWFIDQPLQHFDRTNSQRIITVIYLDHESQINYMKRFIVQQFILEKIYRFIPEAATLLYFSTDEKPLVHVYYGYQKRAQKRDEVIDLSTLRVKSVQAMGNQVSHKPILKVVPMTTDAPPSLSPELPPPVETLASVPLISAEEAIQLSIFEAAQAEAKE